MCQKASSRVLNFPYISLYFFSRELFLEAVHGGSLYRQTNGKFKTRPDAFWHSYIPPISFLKILFLVPKVSHSWIFLKWCFMKIIWHRISIQTLLFQGCLPTRQNGVENRDKAYFPVWMDFSENLEIRKRRINFIPIRTINKLGNFQRFYGNSEISLAMFGTDT